MLIAFCAAWNAGGPDHTGADPPLPSCGSPVIPCCSPARGGLYPPPLTFVPGSEGRDPQERAAVLFDRLASGRMTLRSSRAFPPARTAEAR